VITLKSPREIGLVGEAGRLVAEAHRMIRSSLQPGAEVALLDQLIHEFLVLQGSEPVFKLTGGGNPFPCSTSFSLNDELVGGVPRNRKLREGDLLTVDIGCRRNGWCADAARSYPIGNVNPKNQKLLKFAKSLLDFAIEELEVAKTWAEVAWGMSALVEESEFSLGSGLMGHGVGRELHEDPQVCFSGEECLGKRDFPLEAGLVFTIEPVVVAHATQVKRAANPWTLLTADGSTGVYFEQTVAITENGVKVLTGGMETNGFSD
jgi:methionyl aminopeptidase